MKNRMGRDNLEAMKQQLGKSERERRVLEIELRNADSFSNRLHEISMKLARLEQEKSETSGWIEAKLSEDPLLRRPHDDSVFQLQMQLKDLERKCALQSILQQEVLLEMAACKYDSKGYRLTNFEQMRPSPVEEKPRAAQAYVFSATNRGQDIPAHTGLEPMGRLISLRDTRIDKIPLNGNHGRRMMVAKFDSHNNHDEQLHFRKGDYMVIFGPSDKSGYLHGASLNGQKGLIPQDHVEIVHWSNAKQRKSPFVSHLNPILKVAILNDNPTLSDLYHATEDSQQMPGTEINEMKRNEAYARLNGDLFSVDEEEKENDKRPRAPKDMEILRQLTHSVLVAWKPPERLHVPGQTDPKNKEERNLLLSLAPITSYHIYLDGQFNCSVKATEKSRALVNGVDIDKIHRLSVRSVSNKGQSKDAECTMLVGKGATATPGRLKATQITTNSAKLSWLPGNSNFSHVVFLNDSRVNVCSPGIYKLVLAELPPDKSHRVCVQAVNIDRREKAPSQAPPRPPDGAAFTWDHSNLAVFIEFRTLPVGMPDPPTGVQIEAGPQDGMLLVSWHPVPQDKQLLSNVHLLTVHGYTVCLNGKTVKEVPGATSDHAILNFKEFAQVYKEYCQTLLQNDPEFDVHKDGSLRCLITIHSIVPDPKSSNGTKLIRGAQGPASKPQNVPLNLLLVAAGCLETAVTFFGPDLAAMLGLVCLNLPELPHFSARTRKLHDRLIFP
ncbi:RIMS binding protein [Cichlidogyrus casuarinus]|uniref:RIMS binding protein n=1 Tax=Cichlidogyrus casuarinus TaxID=1844966 RepID=A0ABD2QPC3_9PLAT